MKRPMGYLFVEHDERVLVLKEVERLVRTSRDGLSRGYIEPGHTRCSKPGKNLLKNRARRK